MAEVRTISGPRLFKVDEDDHNCGFSDDDLKVADEIIHRQVGIHHKENNGFLYAATLLDAYREYVSQGKDVPAKAIIRVPTSRDESDNLASVIGDNASNESPQDYYRLMSLWSGLCANYVSALSGSAMFGYFQVPADNIVGYIADVAADEFKIFDPAKNLVLFTAGSSGMCTKLLFYNDDLWYSWANPKMVEYTKSKSNHMGFESTQNITSNVSPGVLFNLLGVDNLFVMWNLLITQPPIMNFDTLKQYSRTLPDFLTVTFNPEIDHEILDPRNSLFGSYRL